jgi:Zn-dependent peptidase ImmA (M78 family)
MPTGSPTLFTAATMAKQLGVSDARVKKAITELGLVPAAKKGCCTYYTAEDLAKLTAVLG